MPKTKKTKKPRPVKKVKKSVKKPTKPTKPKKTKAVKADRLNKSKVCCTKCGECKGISKDRLIKAIAKFGSLEDFHEKYVCRTCRKSHNVRADGAAKPPKRQYKKRLATDPEAYKLPDHLKGPGNPHIGDWQRFKIPAGVSPEKFEKAVRGALADGVKKGYVAA